MIKYKIDVTKIDKSLLFQGKKGVYLNGVFMENRDGKSEYGDDGFIVQDTTKEQREAGERGPIIGNWRHVETKKSAPKASEASAGEHEDTDIPF